MYCENDSNVSIKSVTFLEAVKLKHIIENLLQDSVKGSI